MADPNKRWRVATVAYVAVVAAVLLLCYVGSYFFLGEAWYSGPTEARMRLRMRVFPNRMVARLFGPAAWVESHVRGTIVVAGTDEDLYNASP